VAGYGRLRQPPRALGRVLVTRLTTYQTCSFDLATGLIEHSGSRYRIVLGHGSAEFVCCAIHSDRISWLRGEATHRMATCRSCNEHRPTRVVSVSGGAHLGDKRLCYPCTHLLVDACNRMNGHGHDSIELEKDVPEVVV
jgi:hypothetical protein